MCIVLVSTQDGCCALGANDSEITPRQHADGITHANAQGTTTASLTHHQGNDWYTQARHGGQVGSNSFALAVPLALKGGPGAHCVHEGHHEEPKSLGHLHQAKSKAISMRASHSVVGLLHSLGGVTLERA